MQWGSVALLYLALIGICTGVESLLKENCMKIGSLEVKAFKIKNRKGYAAICGDNLTEGATIQQAYDRMVKAVRRTAKKLK
jgi:hypothetical protein